MHTAKVFQNGQSQAIRLPKKFRFKQKEVSISPLGNGIVIQPLHKSWTEVFHSLILIPNNDFLIKREDFQPQEREGF